ncbi:MAG: hypothetical protein HYX80_03110 [Chloroflexi bacterium]|nr:hypothetical protein [Chloroflexota bacterium]
MAIKKLVCDRCGVVIDIKEDIELALEGTVSWHAFIRARGEEPRGLFPCRNWIQCGGEMIDWKDKDKISGD